MGESRRQKAVTLYNRSAQLARLMKGEISSRPAGEFARYYNVLWQDVKRFVDDPDFERSVPSLGGGGSFLGVLLALTSRYTIKQVRNRAYLLNDYLRDYLVYHYPDLAPQFWPEVEDTEQMEQELDSLRARNLALENELAEAKHRLDQVNEMLLALKTPSQFEIPNVVLDKLDSLERTRLLEVVQAYRVNAWTPAAAVCGMILEGRLQLLCRQYGIRPGGIGEMIRRLGEAGFLKGYYQNLAQVGEFFRHRASHPTSEQFDREKTTLIITSLVILIRDLF